MWFDGGLTGFCRVLKVLYSGLMGLCRGCTWALEWVQVCARFRGEGLRRTCPRTPLGTQGHSRVHFMDLAAVLGLGESIPMLRNTCMMAVIMNSSYPLPRSKTRKPFLYLPVQLCYAPVCEKV